MGKGIEMGLDLMATKWVDRESQLYIEAIPNDKNSTLIFAVRDGAGQCLNKSLVMVCEPSPSNRDAAFLGMCRYVEFGHAATALEQYLSLL